MSGFDFSAVLILPAAQRAAGDALGAAMGWGPDSYSVALSPTGAAPVTHYGCRAQVDQAFTQRLADPPAEALPLLAVLLVDVRPGSDGAAHFADVLTTLGLMQLTE